MQAVKLPFELVRTQKSSFRSLLCLLPLPRDAVIVDVGAGGLVGANTTDHIVELFDGRVVAIEMDEPKSRAVAQKYGGRVDCMHAEYGRYRLAAPFDLIVMDLTPPCAPAFEKLIDFAVADGLKPGGFIIALIVYDIPRALSEGADRFDEAYLAAFQVDASFNRRFFGGEKLDASMLARTYADHPELEFVTLADKWLGEGIFGQVVLRRRQAPKLERPAPSIPLDLTDTQNSGLRVLMAMLGLEQGQAVVTVEESAHFGETTQHILDHHRGEVICFRAAKGESEALQKRFGDRVNAVTGRYGEIGCRRPFDAIVFGCRVEHVPATFDDLLNAAVADGLKPGGYAICGLAHDVEGAFDERTGYFRAPLRAAYQAFMTLYFGTLRLSAPVLEMKYRDHPHFEFVGLVDRWLDTGDRGLGWLVLRRRS